MILILYSCSFFVDGDLQWIYDTMNIPESLLMVGHFAKNRYTWHGWHNLNKVFGTLKSVREKKKYAKQTIMIQKKKYAAQEFDFSKIYSIEDHSIKANAQISIFYYFCSP